MYIHRALESYVLRCSSQFKAVAVLGPRQVGKTTMLRYLAAQQAEEGAPPRGYVSLDDADDRLLAQSDPKLFLQLHPLPLLIDEAQRAPELFPYLKMTLDETGETGSLWLTGSQPLGLRERFAETLAGRIALLRLWGFSQSELAGRPTEHFTCDTAYFAARSASAAPRSAPEVYHAIWKGGLPGVCLGEDDLWRTAYASYVDTYLMRDILTATTIKDEGRFRRFLSACAALTGQPVNYAELSRAADVSEPTARDWLSILTSTFMVHTVPAFTSSKLSRLAKTPVLHFADTGLASYLSGWYNPDALSVGALSGHILETFAWSEIVKSHQATGEEPDLSFLRTGRQKEIDLVLSANGKDHPIEVKRTASPGQKDIRNFSVMDPLGPERGIGCVLCLSDRARPITREAWAFPLWAI